MEYLMKKMDGNIFLLMETQKREDMLMVIYVRMILKKYKKCYTF